MQTPGTVDLVPDYTPNELEDMLQLEKAELIELLVRERRGWRRLLEELEEQHLSEWEALERDLASTLDRCTKEQQNWEGVLSNLSDLFSRDSPY